MAQPMSQQSTQAIVAIVFGIVMFFLTVMTLCQGYRDKCRHMKAIFASGKAGASDSYLDEANIEDGISTAVQHRPNQSNSVIICQCLIACGLSKLTNSSESHPIQNIR